MSDERTAKRLAHEWARRIRRRPANECSSAVKMAAWAFADRASLVTDDVARELGLELEHLGAVAAWPSVATLAADTGQGSERNMRRLIEALTGGARDIVVHERRHLRLPSVYLLAWNGEPIRVDAGSDRADLTGRTTGRIDPVAHSVRPGGSDRSNDRATGRICPERPGGSVRSDRADPTGPIKEEPIREPNREPKAAARVDACAGTGADARVREAASAARRAWEHATGGALNPDHEHELDELAAVCVAQSDRHGGEVGTIAADAVMGFFAMRDDVTRPRPAWVRERFGRYLARGLRDRRRGELDQADAQRLEEPSDALEKPPAEAYAFLATVKGPASAERRVVLPVEKAARAAKAGS